MLLFFFFKQKTAYEMRISDWSSDVCSSDLTKLVGRIVAARALARRCCGAAHARRAVLGARPSDLCRLREPRGRSQDRDRKGRARRCQGAIVGAAPREKDRKSTRLNSSH